MLALPALLAGSLAVFTASTPTVPLDATSDDVCSVTSWEVQWGVKESFRSYLSGSIANGEWITEGDVSYQTPVFTFLGSEGSVAKDLSSGELSTTGSIRFLGHAGILDQTLSEPRVVFDSTDTVFLVVDVYGATQEGDFIDRQAVEFVEVDVSEASVDFESGVFEVTDAASVFTEAGAEAFGTYPAGEQFDPMSLRFTTEPGCLSSSPSVPVTALLGGVLAVVLAVAATVWVRKSRGPGHPEPEKS